jgi:hypothetical protein
MVLKVYFHHRNLFSGVLDNINIKRHIIILHNSFVVIVTKDLIIIIKDKTFIYFIIDFIDKAFIFAFIGYVIIHFDFF